MGGYASIDEMTEAVAAPRGPTRRTLVAHPVVGVADLDGDVLTGAGDDLRIMIHDAEPGRASAERLAPNS